jgi:hypothetical protein
MPYRPLAVHLIRSLTAIALSLLTFAVLVELHSRASLVRDFTLFVVPVSIAVGYIPLWRWYPRDAYPIGLMFCPAMLVVLVYFHQWLTRWR